MMQLVEQHVITPKSEDWSEIDAAAFASKNLYNLANYHMRQRFFAEGIVWSYPDLYAMLKNSPAYQALPRKVSQQVLNGVFFIWKSYFAAHESFSEDSSKFLGEPKIPKYKDKLSGRNVLTYTIQAISQPLLRIGQVKLSGLSLIVQTAKKLIDCVRIVPKKTHYVVEIVYSVAPTIVDLDSSLYAGVDLGVNNLAVISSNKPGLMPVVVNGRPLKSINQFYNKRTSELVSALTKQDARRRTSHRIDRLTEKRNRRIDHYLHTASRRIIDGLVKERIGTLIIGKNDGWKQGIHNGKQNNQNFVSIPHTRFIDQLTYKAALVSIKVIINEESHTSKCSFLDNEPICHHDSYVGKRIKRGLFRSAKGLFINADLNGALNIIRKVAPGAFAFFFQKDGFAKGVEGVVVRPLPLGIN